METFPVDIEPAHSPLGASCNDRWLNCAGSINLIRTKKLKDEPNEYSAQGTVAHSIAALVLNGTQELWEFAGETWTQDGFKIDVDQDMVDGIALYIDLINAERKGALARFIERKVNLKEFHPDLWGTLDAGLVFPKKVTIYDFKYGLVFVGAEENTQLMQYGASLVNEIHEQFPELEEIEFVIVQPRSFHGAGPIRRHTMTIDTLGEWMGAVLVTGAKKTEDPDAPLNFGSWCRYCPAQSVKHCSKIKARVDSIMNGAAYGAATEQATTEAAASLMDEWEIAEQLDLEKVVQHHFKLLKDEAFKRMMNGGHIPGRKIVMGKTNRVWKDGAVNKIKKMLGKDAFTDPKLKSPSQIEKTGKPGKALAAELAFKPKGALTMAPIDDTRNAVQPRDIGALLNSV